MGPATTVVRPRRALWPEMEATMATIKKKAAAKKTATKSANNDGRAVLVTTDKRGVFFGFLVGEPSKAQVTLRACRMVVSWDPATRGIVGLVSAGPTPGCRITGAAGAASILYDVTSVLECTDAAKARFEAAPWA